MYCFTNTTDVVQQLETIIRNARLRQRFIFMIAINRDTLIRESRKKNSKGDGNSDLDFLTSLNKNWINYVSGKYYY